MPHGAPYEQAHRFNKSINVRLKDYQIVTNQYSVIADEVDVSFTFQAGDGYFDVSRDGGSFVKPALDAALNAVDYPGIVSDVQERAPSRLRAFVVAPLEQPYDVSKTSLRLHDYFVEAVRGPLEEELHESLGVNLTSLSFWGTTVIPR